jgi:prepilin-type N-terminal cleavage/methylation domain-containing protein
MKKRRDGFTMIELLVVALAAAMLALTAGFMLLVSYRTWIANRGYVDLQREISLTQTIGDRWVREAAHWEVTSTNSDLRIVTEAGTKRLYSDAGNLYFDPDTGIDGDELLVSSDHVTDFSAEATALGVHLDLLLEYRATSAELHTFISYRN